MGVFFFFSSRRQSTKALDLNPDERNSSCTEVNIICDYCVCLEVLFLISNLQNIAISMIV